MSAQSQKEDQERVYYLVPSVAEDAAAAVAEEEDDDEDDGPHDVKEDIERECMETKECAPIKQKFDVCTERVNSNPDSEEDCVEVMIIIIFSIVDYELCDLSWLQEFFDLMHCVHKCVSSECLSYYVLHVWNIIRVGSGKVLSSFEMTMIMWEIYIKSDS